MNSKEEANRMSSFGTAPSCRYLLFPSIGTVHYITHQETGKSDKLVVLCPFCWPTRISRWRFEYKNMMATWQPVKVSLVYQWSTGHQTEVCNSAVLEHFSTTRHTFIQLLWPVIKHQDYCLTAFTFNWLIIWRRKGTTRRLFPQVRFKVPQAQANYHCLCLCSASNFSLLVLSWHTKKIFFCFKLNSVPLKASSE